MSGVSLREITDHDREAVVGLRTAASQDAYVSWASVRSSEPARVNTPRLGLEQLA